MATTLRLFFNLHKILIKQHRISLEQPQSSPLSLEDQVTSIYAGTNGYLDKLEVSQVRSFLAGFRQYMADKHSKYGEILRSTLTFTPEAEGLVKQAIAEYYDEFKSGK